MRVIHTSSWPDRAWYAPHCLYHRESSLTGWRSDVECENVQGPRNGVLASARTPAPWAVGLLCGGGLATRVYAEAEERYRL